MKRFLMLLAVAAVAGGMYVAAAPGHSAHAGPTWKQFTALQKQVAALKKDDKTLKTVASISLAYFNACVKGAVPIDQFGDPAGQSGTPEGYEYSKGTAGTGSVFTTAIDAAATNDTGALWITGGNASCGQLVNGSGLRHAAAAAGLSLPHGSLHASFSAHRP